MKYLPIISAAVTILSIVSAQVSDFNQETQTWVCGKANAAYCAGTEVTNIIIRCNGTVGRETNCNDVLAFEPPVGTNFAPCIQTNAFTGDAACSKNGIVYDASGALNAPNTTHPVPANATTSLPPVTPLSSSSPTLATTTSKLATKPSGAVGTSITPVSTATGSLLPVTNSASSLSVASGVVIFAAALFAGSL